MYLGDLDAFVHLVHGFPDQPKFDDGAMMLHKAGIRCATTGGHFWCAVGFNLHGAGHKFRQGARRCDEAFA